MARMISLREVIGMCKKLSRLYLIIAIFNSMTTIWWIVWLFVAPSLGVFINCIMFGLTAIGASMCSYEFGKVEDETESR